ncbi:DUF1631 family protein [Halopseudomonas pelagia]|uniref:DUF1631 family protein n=1 Tax=Halopseudomonas pelagia TaxID=553151 RepID=UPI0030DC8238|tara:strand:+ start:3980 stop:7855 length:3876 start_codon:yes stop_codon:yes gene_type:complete
MEKRRWPRKAAEFNAVLSLSLNDNFRCIIRDFSQAGMLVSLDDLVLARLKRSVSASQARPASICLELSDRSIAMDVQVVRFTEQGAGLRLADPSPENYRALQEATEGNQRAAAPMPRKLLAGQSQLSPEHRKVLAKTTNLAFQQFLEDHFTRYFGQLETALLVEADRQKTQALQQPFFDAIALFRKQRQRVLGATVNRIGETAMDIALGRQVPEQVAEQNEGKTQTLTLVDKHDFEDWLVVRVAISRTELEVRDSLIELQLRIDAAFGSRSTSRTFNPYSPSALCNTFFEVIRHLGLSNRVVEVVFKVLQESILAHLETIYQELNRSFVQANILPGLDVNHYLASQAQQARPQQASPSTAAADTPRTDEYSAVPPAAPGSAEETALEQQTPASASTAVAGQAFNAASQLMSLQRQLTPAGGEQPNSGQTSSQQPSRAALTALDTMKARLLQGQVSFKGPGALKSQLIQSNGGVRIDLSEFEHDSVEMIESLFDSIVQNERVAEDLKEELRKLQVPLLKIMLKDPELFSGDFHPARQAVNYLALLSDQGSIHLEANKGPIRESIQHILESEDDTLAFSQSLDNLDTLVTREKRFIDRNLNRIRETCAGQQRLIQANRQIERQLSELFDRPVPSALIDLVNHGWKDLMRLSYLREGINSASWNMTQTVICDLLWHLLPQTNTQRQQPHAVDYLLKLLGKGLSKVPENGYAHTELLERISQLLASGVQDTTPMALYSSAELNSEVLEERLASQVETDKGLMRWLKRARNLKVSQWFELTQAGQQTQLYQLVWMADDASQFMFANHHGTKTSGLSLEQVAQLLRDGHLELLHDAAMPAVEQGLDALVQKIYDKLSFDSAHDQLTGLLTRKEFSRCLAQCVAQAQQEQTAHTLIFFDIQQFKVINNTCGYETGDRFLRDLARRISSFVDEEALVGRVGPDQFAILAPIDADKAGYRLATELKTAIETTRFVHKQHSFVINTVMAMLGFDQANQKIMDLLRSVETAAEISKRSGHKDIQFVLPGDERLEELDEAMLWVTRINRALDENNLKLRCQKIAPLDTQEAALPHYEVLLTVIDDQGEHMPPADFIKVAEDYNRMGSVDRWVIETVLRWMMEHQDQLHLFGGFSINLSGHSMNDDSFLDFIFDALVRYQVPRDKLIFEITETTAVANLEDAADFINEMRSIGCRFSLDDFGVGQSSYSYLKRLPVDFIKIDGAFVRDITRSDVDFALVRSITEMGHYLNKKVIAEYVSAQDILDTVRTIGVDYVQGHVHGLPGLLDQLNLKALPDKLSDQAPA